MKYLSLTKMIIKLLILLIMIVMLFILSTILYSARYWRDLHNYINADIKIKRIPTITEMNITIVDEIIFNATTEVYDDTTGTIDDYNDYFSLNDVENSREKRNHFNIDDFEVINPEDNLKVIKDLIDESKLTTSNHNDVEIFENHIHNKEDKDNVQDAQAIFPWIAAIYIKNDTDDQFKYYCDGALLSNKTIVTAARCIRGTNRSVAADDIIVLLGKNSLQTTSDNEIVAKVDEVYIHDNFTGGSENDIAVLSLEDEVELSESIHPARLGDETEYDEAYTTGWAFTGELSAIHFQKDSNCNHYLQDNNTFCAAYGNEVSVCPSYGGLFAVQANSTWYLQGIRTADPTERAICINRPVVFTALEYYYPWLSQFV
ncbi:serine protease gd-like isoform X1 [Aricia agestis]|uniref:serine protease gd-like isoform X1 n=1 Tax=Aricia agestis TaxID=91739 RepID=UPI001C20AD1E|nr:serine protease gd-like isoform X1 [Aricia agestis]